MRSESIEAARAREVAAFEAWIRREYSSEVTWERGEDHPSFAPLPQYSDIVDPEETRDELDRLSLWEEWTAWKARAALALPRESPDAEAVRHAADAEAVREDAAKITDGYAETMEGGDAEGSRYSAGGVARKLRRLAAAIRALPLPAPDEVERARRAFYEAAREWFALDYAAKRPPFPNPGQREWDRVWGNMADQYVLLLRAERAAAKGGAS